MEKIRFTEQIVNLHQQMCSAIWIDGIARFGADVLRRR